MNMNKKLISFLLIICMVLSLFPVSAFANGQQLTTAPSWGGNDVTSVTSGSATTFTLNNDVTTSQVLQITSGQSATLDLNGHTLTSQKSDGAIIQNEGTLTIENGSATTTPSMIKATSGSALILENNGKTTINGSGIEFSGALQNNASGNMSLQDGIYNAASKVTNAGTLWIYDGDFAGAIENSASLAIKGGTFDGTLENVASAADATINIYGGYFKIQPDEAFLAEGYHFVPAADKEGYVTAIYTKVEDEVIIQDPVVDAPPNTPPAVVDAVKTLTPAESSDTATLTQAALAVVSNADRDTVVAKLNAEVPASVGQPVTVVVTPYFDIKIKGYDNNQLALDISPMYLLKATTDKNNMEESGPNKNTVALDPQPVNFDSTQPITLSLQLPDGFTANFVKHQKSAAEGGAVYYYSVTTTNGISTFEVENGFSEFTFLTDNRKGTIDYSDSKDYSYLATYTLASVGQALPLPLIQQNNFIGWEIEGTTYTHLTDELLTLIDGRTVKATAKYSSGGSSSGGSSSSGGGAAAPRATVTSPDNDVIITYTGLPINLVNSVVEAVAQNKNVQVVGGSSSSVRISAKKNGAVLNSFSSPLTVTVPVSKAALSTVTDTSRLTLAKVTKAADGKISLTYMGGNYNKDKNNFTAYVDEPGDYVLIADNNVQKIELQVGKKDNTINGRTVTNDVAPVIVNNRTMIPLRFVSESLGGQVNWEQASSTATIKMNGVTMKMTIGQKMEGFDTAPIIKDGRTMVPIRYIAEKLGANVIYVPDTQEIIVVK